jgi:hypothetical protein
MPTLSDALAETATVLETVAPFDGVAIETMGGVVSADELLTVTVTAVLVALFPAASLAIASSVCDPLLVLLVSHEYK